MPHTAARLVAAALFTVLATASFPATAGEPKPKAPKLTPELALKGRTTYLASCAACHGEKGDGAGPTGMYLNPKPRHFEKEPFKQGESVEQIFATLNTGVAGTAMVAFPQLSEEERWATAWFVAHFRPSKDGKKAKKIIEALPALGSAPPATATATVPTPTPTPPASEATPR
jgi:mono/diheme cytochrome c family protein